MLFKRCLFFIAITLLTFSVAVSIPSGRRSGESSRAAGRHSKTPKWYRLKGSEFSRSQRRKHGFYEREKAKIKADPNYAVNRMKQMHGIPEPDDEFHVCGHKYNGTHVRRAIVNAFTPCEVAKYPKHYGNFAYPDEHPHHGECPIQGDVRGLRLEEMPVIHDKDGWKNGVIPGGARAIFSRQKGDKGDVFHGVIGHDETTNKLHNRADHIKRRVGDG